MACTCFVVRRPPRRRSPISGARLPVVSANACYCCAPAIVISRSSRTTMGVRAPMGSRCAEWSAWLQAKKWAVQIFMFQDRDWGLRRRRSRPLWPRRQQSRRLCNSMPDYCALSGCLVLAAGGDCRRPSGYNKQCKREQWNMSAETETRQIVKKRSLLILMNLFEFRLDGKNDGLFLFDMPLYFDIATLWIKFYRVEYFSSQTDKKS